VELLVKHGYEVNQRMILTGSSIPTLPILEAIAIQNDAMFEILLPKADLTLKAGPLATNALQYAVLEKRRDYVEKILAMEGPNFNDASFWNERTGSQGGWTSVMIAVSKDDDAMGKLLLEEGLSQDVAMDDGSTALHIAVRRKQLSLCQLLIQYGCNVHKVNDRDNTALTEACSRDDDRASHIVRTLLSAEADCRVQDRLGRPGPLHLASECGHKDIVEMLLELPNPPDLDSCGKDFPTPLGYAVFFDHLEIVEIISKAGADINCLFADNGSPLLTAIKRGREDIVAALLRYNANRLGGRHNNWTPLHHCALHGKFELLKLLLSNHPQEILNFAAGRNENEGTALYQACLGGNFKVAKYLIRLGATVHGRFGNDRSSLLHAAAIGGNKRLVKYLLQKQGFKIEEPGDEGLSPLILACREGHRKVATFLVQRGADPRRRPEKGPTALVACAILSSPNFVKITKLLLRKSGSEFDTEDLNQAFLMACERGKDQMANILLSMGADPNFRDAGDEWTGLQLAAVKGHDEIIERLLKDDRIDLLVTDHKKRMALHLACNLNRTSIIALLLLRKESEMSVSQLNIEERLLSSKDIYGLIAIRCCSIRATTSNMVSSLRADCFRDSNSLSTPMDFRTKFVMYPLRCSV
jgi:ankyrin repeat protein